MIFSNKSSSSNSFSGLRGEGVRGLGGAGVIGRGVAPSSSDITLLKWCNIMAHRLTKLGV